MKFLNKLVRFTLMRTGVWGLFYIALVEGVKGAQNVLLFLAWAVSILLIINYLGQSDKTIQKSLETYKPPEASLMRKVVGAEVCLMVVTFLWFDFVVTAIAIAIAVACSYTYYQNIKEAYEESKKEIPE